MKYKVTAENPFEYFKTGDCVEPLPDKPQYRPQGLYAGNLPLAPAEIVENNPQWFEPVEEWGLKCETFSLMHGHGLITGEFNVIRKDNSAVFLQNVDDDTAEAIKDALNNM